MSEQHGEQPAMTLGTPAAGRWEWVHLALLVAMGVASAVLWARVPGRIPVHWNLSGEVDRFGGRLEGLLLLPLVAAALYALLRLLPRIDPARANYASFTGPYEVIRLGVTVKLAVVHALVLASAFDPSVPMDRVMPIGIGLLLIVFGNVLGKIRPNYLVGVRTPWTLASARSWDKTHRAGGRIFVAAGVALTASGLVGASWMLVASGLVGLLSLAWLVYYSFAVWRADPDRVPATATRPSEEPDR